jgi:hypothetical protein
LEELIEYDFPLMAWKVAYTTRVNGERYDYAPPQFTFEEEPTEALLVKCRAEARAAFERKL